MNKFFKIPKIEFLLQQNRLTLKNIFLLLVLVRVHCEDEIRLRRSIDRSIRFVSAFTISALEKIESYTH